jgi:hypothetical protein
VAGEVHGRQADLRRSKPKRTKKSGPDSTGDHAKINTWPDLKRQISIQRRTMERRIKFQKKTVMEFINSRD